MPDAARLAPQWYWLHAILCLLAAECQLWCWSTCQNRVALVDDMLCCVGTGDFFRPGRLYCSLGKVLVVGKDGGLSQPTEQELKKKIFYAGAAHAEDRLDVTWQLSVM